MFLFSALFLSETRTGTTLKRKFCFFVAVCLPVLLAACRSMTVGTDTAVYVERLATIVNGYNTIFDYIISNPFNWGIEKGYLALTYVCVKYFGGIRVLLGVIELLVILPVYRRILDFKNRNSVFLMALIFLLLTYNRSLNLSRQCIAMSLVFFGSRFLNFKDKLCIKYFIFVFIACLFHTSAILAIPIYLYYLISISKLKKWGMTLAVISILGAITMYANIGQILMAIFGEGFKYIKYFATSSTGHLSKPDILFRLVVLLTTIALAKKNKLINCYFGLKDEVSTVNRKCVYYFYQLIALNYLLLYFLTAINGDNYRFALYFEFVVPVVMAQSFRLFRKDNKTLVTFFVSIFYFINWYIFMIIGDGYGTIPYILGI